MLRDLTVSSTARPYMVCAMVHASVSKRRTLQGFYIWFMLSFMVQKIMTKIG